MSYGNELQRAIQEDAAIRLRNREQREVRMAKALREGLDTAAMVERFGVDESVVHTLRRKLGIPSPEPFLLGPRYKRSKRRG